MQAVAGETPRGAPKGKGMGLNLSGKADRTHVLPLESSRKGRRRSKAICLNSQAQGQGRPQRFLSVRFFMTKKPPRRQGGQKRLGRVACPESAGRPGVFIALI